MSLLKWQELAKNKSKLGNKINFVHDTITEKNLGEKVSETSFKKAFKPITSKLNDVMISNLQKPIKKMKMKTKNDEMEEIDYAPEVDPFEDWDVENLIMQDLPPAYQESKEVPDYATYTDVEDSDVEDNDAEDTNEDEYGEEQITPKDFGLPSQDVVTTDLLEKDKKGKTLYLKDLIIQAKRERNRLNGFKSANTKKFDAGKITASERDKTKMLLNKSQVVLTDYIDHYVGIQKTLKQKTFEGTGMKKRGGNIIFFNDSKQLLKKLEIIIGSMMAGNTSKEIRDTGVAILDMLLRTSSINKAQHEVLYKKYFKLK